MILKYNIENFRSIYKKREINFEAKKIIDHSDNELHLLNNHILPVISIYGANGGGKTSIIESLIVLQNVLFNNQVINNPNNNNNKQPTISDYIQTMKNDELKNKPIKWEIEFIVKNEILKYKLNYNKQVIFEEYVIENIQTKETKTIFRYDEELEHKYLLNGSTTPLNNINHISSAISYINTFFKNEDIEKLLNEFKKIISIPNLNFEFAPYKVFQNFIINKVDAELIKENIKIIEGVFKDLGINIKTLKLIQMPLVNSYVINSVKLNTYNEKFELPFEYESNGTKKLLFLMITIIKKINNNAIFVVDELDSGLHTMLLKYIISLFTHQRNTEAQLIFTSHDIGTLNNEIFRRDEIYFAGLNENNFTNLVSLYDFGSTVRNNQSYSKIYLDEKLGYYPYIDYALNGFYGKK